LDASATEQTQAVCKYEEKVVGVLGWRACDSQDYSNYLQRKSDQTQEADSKIHRTISDNTEDKSTSLWDRFTTALGKLAYGIYS